MYHWQEMDVCVEVSGAAVDWLPILMTAMLIREIFIDSGDPETSQTCTTHAREHARMRMEHTHVHC